MSGKTDHDGGASDSLPSVDFPTVDKRWISNDLQILRSGLFADAEIICEGCDTPRKVHRNILAGRSIWFKKAFFGDFKEAEDRKINLQETPWRVDLMLYFFYTGGMDMSDEALTSGHDVMNVSIELLRLGDFFQSIDMSRHGRWMLAKFLAGVLSRSCNTKHDSTSNEAWLKANADFPKHFCDAVVNAFDKERPVKVAQGVLADFALAARIHLFKNDEFKSFISDKVVPEFGNLVLKAIMTGSVSSVFDCNTVFKQWKDWQVTPQFAQKPRTEASNGTGTSSPGVSTPTSTAPPAAPGGSSTATPAAANRFSTAAPAVSNAFSTASPEVAGFGRGRGRGSGGRRTGF